MVCATPQEQQSGLEGVEVFQDSLSATPGYTPNTRPYPASPCASE